MRVSLTGLSLLALGAGCIPSHRLVHDGNRYFEHCYGADFNPRVTPIQKEACWQAWIAHYTRHQSAQRVDYALRRIEALQSGAEPPSLPGVTASRPAVLAADEAHLANLTHGMTPPGSTLPAPEAGAEEIPNGCLEACNTYERRCLSECPERNVNCMQRCTRERAICLGGCH
jgi:hypothetical protein